MKADRRQFFHGRRAIVTGGAGLIGSFLVQKLVESGAETTVIDDFSKGHRDHLSGVADKIRISEGNLEDPTFARTALDGSDLVFHLASRAYGIGYGHGHHLQILQHNERITNNLLDALSISPPAHLLVTSSSCVYDDAGPDTLPELPVFDGAPEAVNWGYGWAKRFLEQKASLYAREVGIPTTIVRPFNVYGERYRWVGQFSQAIPMLVKRVMGGENPVVVWGSGKQRRSYVHAADCSAMMMALVEAGYTAEPVNLGTEETISIHELVKAICKAARATPELICDTEQPEGRFVKSADMTRFETIVPDFEFSVSLEQGLDKMTAWYSSTFGPGASGDGSPEQAEISGK